MKQMSRNIQNILIVRVRHFVEMFGYTKDFVHLFLSGTIDLS